MRKKIYDIVHVYDANIFSKIYKYFMLFIIALSLVPLVFKETNAVFIVIDMVCLIVYIIDFILRFITADYKFKKFHWSSFVRYPFRLISIIDLLAILAFLSFVFSWLRAFKIIEALKVLRVVRVFRYSKSMLIIAEIIRKTKNALLAVAALAIGYIITSAIIMFNVEPDIFTNFIDAVYWATVTLTTVGFGDITPVTSIGRFIVVLSSFVGIGIVALPSGILTAGYMDTVKEIEFEEKYGNKRTRK